MMAVSLVTAAAHMVQIAISAGVFVMFTVLNRLIANRLHHPPESGAPFAAEELVREGANDS